MGKYHKVFGNLKRPDGVSFEDFKKWWQEVHVPRVMKWAGLVAPMTSISLSTKTSRLMAWGSLGSTTALKVFQTPEGASACRRLDCGRIASMTDFSDMFPPTNRPAFLPAWFTGENVTGRGQYFDTTGAPPQPKR